MNEMYVMVNNGIRYWFESYPIPGEDPVAYFNLQAAVDEANVLRAEFLNPMIYIYELKRVDVVLLDPYTQVVCYVCGQPVNKSEAVELEWGDFVHPSCKEKL